MADLVVDTGLLRASAAHLASIAAASREVADGHLRLHEVVFAAGNEAAAQGLDSFLCAWAYGVRCIASQADAVDHELTTCACAYEAAETALSTAAGGSGALAAPLAPLAPRAFDELRVAPRYTGRGVPVQLSAATHVSQLIPGEPDQVALAARQLMRFADDLADAHRNLGQISFGKWQGAAATVAMRDLDQLKARLVTAERAFADAGNATAKYARAHADARADAARALQLWQSAKHASDIAHGLAVGAMPADAPDDPNAVLARAAALCRDAEDRFLAAGHALSDTLKHAREGHPQHPGLLSNLRRAVRSFGLGLTDFVAGPVEGITLAIELGVRLVNVEEAVDHPGAYFATWGALLEGVAHVVLHPEDIGRSMLEWDEWGKDPARALGEVLPELIGIGLAARQLGATRGVAADTRLANDTKLVNDPKSVSKLMLEQDNAETMAQRLEQLHLDPQSAAGRAAREQFDLPLGNADHWRPLRLKPGERVLVTPDGYAALMDGSVPTDAQKLSESLQLPPRRDKLVNGLASQPHYVDRAQLFDIGPDGLDTVGTTATANPQLGMGGGTRLSISDIHAARANGRLINPEVHKFDMDTLKSRIEDPRYSLVDPDLPARPLDPDREVVAGRVERVAEDVRGNVRGAAIAAATSRATDRTDKGAR